jgi:predicted lipoprotein with Yx(FWY)xxD motif
MAIFFKKSCTLIVCLLLMSVVACKKDDSSEPTPEANVKVANNATFGKYLTDKAGKTLYYFAKDVDGISACSGGCLTNWPVFYEATLVLGEGLSSGDFGEITRADGSKQNTYKGWPLYYFSGDANTGTIAGQNVGGIWFLAKPDYTVMLANKTINAVDTKYMVNATGRAIYTFNNDTANQSNCSGGCVTNWPLFQTGASVYPPAFTADFGSINRADGQAQITYQSKPIYYFAQDTQRGDVKGQGVGGVWFLTAPNKP